MSTAFGVFGEEVAADRNACHLRSACVNLQCQLIIWGFTILGVLCCSLNLATRELTHAPLGVSLLAILWFFGTGATATGVKYLSLRRVLPCERQGRPRALVFKPWRIAFAVAAVYIVLYCVFWSESLSSQSPGCVALQTSVHSNSCHTSIIYSNPDRSVNSQSLYGQRDTGFGYASALSDTPGFVSTGLT